MIEINNLFKSYGKTEVLKNLNMTIKTGSLFGLIGVNGSGKSTLLRIIAGVFRADSGEILIDGEKIFENEKKKREMFFLPDDPFYTLNITGAKMAEMYKIFYDFDEIAFKKYINIFRLDIYSPVRNFSKGMKRQLCVCLAFAVKPKILLLDEVFDGLDPFARQTFKRGLLELSEQTGCTAIIASHSLRELEDICDSFGLIDNKALLESGNISDSLENIFKFQIAFNEEVEKEEFKFDYLSIDISGRIVKITAKGDKTELLNQITAMNPIFIDELPVNFEELFISEIKAKEARK